MKVTIDGETVKLEPIAEDGKVTALRLIGPGTYNGHLHGKVGAASYCIPEVVDSVAKMSYQTCPGVPAEFGPPYIASLWYDRENADAL